MPFSPAPQRWLLHAQHSFHPLHKGVAIATLFSPSPRRCCYMHNTLFTLSTKVLLHAQHSFHPLHKGVATCTTLFSPTPQRCCYSNTIFTHSTKVLLHSPTPQRCCYMHDTLFTHSRGKDYSDCSCQRTD